MTPSASTNLSFTIVVIEIAGGKSLEACLKSLRQFNLDCIVILREQDSLLQARFSNVMFDIFNKPVPLRRKRGVALATGDIVVLIEDTTIPDITFLEGLSIAFEDGKCVAASGPVAIGRNLSPRYQAMACTEYGRYHSTVLFADSQKQRIDVDRLPGNLICYRKDNLNSVLESIDDGLVEGIINHHLLLQGADIVMVSKLSCTYCGQDTWGARFSTRFYHGWIYAGGLADKKGITGRIIQSFKSLLLPVILPLRAIRFMSGMDEIDRPVSVAFWIFSLEVFWSMGEFAGSLFGKPETMEHWR